MENETITLSEVIQDNPQATFRVTYKGMKYNCKYDSDQKHFYSYIKSNGKYPKIIIMQPSFVKDCEVYCRSKYIGYKVIINN